MTVTKSSTCGRESSRSLRRESASPENSRQKKAFDSDVGHGRGCGQLWDMIATDTSVDTSEIISDQFFTHPWLSLLRPI